MASTWAAAGESSTRLSLAIRREGTAGYGWKATPTFE
jgi:hypothetical protein